MWSCLLGLRPLRSPEISRTLRFRDSFMCSSTGTCLFRYQKSNMQSFTFYYTVTPTGNRHCLLACAFPFPPPSLCPRGEGRVLRRKRVSRKQGLQGEPGDTRCVQLSLQVGGLLPSQTEALARWQVPSDAGRSMRPP